MTGDAAELRERDQSGGSGKINAEVRMSAIFTILG
jgi:hypothetical protein